MSEATIQINGTRFTKWLGELNGANQTALLVVATGTEKGAAGISVRFAHDVSTSQMVSLLQGVIAGIESGQVKIVKP